MVLNFLLEGMLVTLCVLDLLKMILPIESSKQWLYLPWVFKKRSPNPNWSRHGSINSPRRLYSLLYYIQ